MTLDRSGNIAVERTDSPRQSPRVVSHANRRPYTSLTTGRVTPLWFAFFFLHTFVDAEFNFIGSGPPDLDAREAKLGSQHLGGVPPCLYPMSCRDQRDLLPLPCGDELFEFIARGSVSASVGTPAKVSRSRWRAVKWLEHGCRALNEMACCGSREVQSLSMAQVASLDHMLPLYSSAARKCHGHDNLKAFRSIQGGRGGYSAEPGCSTGSYALSTGQET